MYVLSINDTEYKAIETWPEMPISKAIELQQAIDDIPPLLRELYDLNAQEKPDPKELTKISKKIQSTDRIKHFPLFYGEIMRVLTTIPGDVLDHIMWDVRTEFYKAYCERIVLGILYGDYSRIKNIKSFKFKNQTYWLPTSSSVVGRSKPMDNTQTIEFTEVVDLEIYSEDLKGGKYEVAANIVAVLCRPLKEPLKAIVEVGSDLLLGNKDDNWNHIETYDEKTCLARAKEFMELPMDIVWEVFFCILQLSTISSQNILISRLRKGLEDQRRLRLPGLPASGGMAVSWRSPRLTSLQET